MASSSATNIFGLKLNLLSVLLPWVEQALCHVGKSLKIHNSAIDAYTSNDRGPQENDEISSLNYTMRHKLLEMNLGS